MALAAFACALAWFDVIPGGWTLRNLVEPQAARDAKTRAAHRAERLRQFADDAPVPGGALFIGSSTIEGFDDLPTGAINRGIGDEELALLALRFKGTLERTRPRDVVLYAASVDVRRPTLHGEEDSPPNRYRGAADLASAVMELVDLALAGEPARTVLVLGVLPEVDDERGVTERARALNRELADRAAARPRALFVPTWRPPLVDPATGLLQAGCARDRLHLNRAGYEHLAAWLLEAHPTLAGGSR